jgi:hypothetical protein
MEKKVDLMQLKQAIEYQIEAIIGQFLRARNKMIAAKEQDDFDEIDLRLAAVVQHLEDYTSTGKR